MAHKNNSGAAPEAGNLAEIMSEGVVDDLDRVREELETRMHWVWQRNLKAKASEAVELFKESL